MSSLQSRAKPYLVPLIQGQWPEMNQWAIRSIVVWITMFTMVFEFRDPATAAITFDQRDEFRRRRDPPSDWKVWIAKIEPTKWRGRSLHTGIMLYNPKEDPLNRPANLQITTGVIGKLLFHSYHVAPGVFSQDPLTSDYGPAMGLTKIWPPPISMPIKPMGIMSDRDADDVATTLKSVIADAHR